MIFNILAVLFNFSAMLSFLSRKRHIIVYVFIFYNAVNDYLFYTMGYLAGQGAIYKAFNELLLVGLFVYFFTVKFKQRDLKFSVDTLVILSVSVLCLMIGILNNGFSNAFTDWRDIFLYLIILLLFRDLGYLRKLSLRNLENFLIVLALISTLFACYEYVNYDGNYASIWRYELLLQAKIQQSEDFLEHFVSYQLVRGNNLRASAFFVSALEFAFFLSVAAIFIVRRIKEENNINNTLFLFGCLLLLLCGMYVSQVRTSMIVFFIFIAVMSLSYFMEVKKSFVISLLYFFPTLVLIILVLFHNYLDTSTAGRYFQYLDVLTSSSSIIPQGLGTFRQKYDSYFLYLISNMGVFGVGILFFIFKGITKAIDRSDLTVSILIMTVPFVMTMQHVAGTFYYIVILTLFYYPYEKLKYKRGAS